ncbi:MAG: putative esterase [Nocardia sp.]|uniref:alpha/beta hydrolase n=1 Tax=Nocardia sp. TaxID=1821 RepID=UPI00260DCF4F|nr:alpha/beta hydrolase [Nocardia sp.]MCU1647042.1 putative esterase [Nocardia sp.]
MPAQSRNAAFDRAPESVTIELRGRASLPLRIAHPLSYNTLRRSMNTLVWLGGKRPLRGHTGIFAPVELADPLARVLIPPRGTERRAVRFENFRAEWVWHTNTVDPQRLRDAAILYFHGGGFVACGLNTHRRIVARIARESGMPLLNVDYRQLPWAHITDTIEDCVAAYRHLLAEGFEPEHIVFAGDSAGGGLAFTTALEARNRGLPVPGGIAAIAPWADLDSTDKVAHPNNRVDPMLSGEALAIPAIWGFAVDGRLDPLWSPVNRDFSGMPPVLIQVGSTEVLRADADKLAERCAEAGVECRVQVWDKAIHVFHAAADILPDAREAIREIGRFNQRIGHGEVAAWLAPRPRLRDRVLRRRVAA